MTDTTIDSTTSSEERRDSGAPPVPTVRRLFVRDRILDEGPCVLARGDTVKVRFRIPGGEAVLGSSRFVLAPIQCY